MRFHMLGYRNALGVNAADTDLIAAVDPEFSQRNNHYIFSEQYSVIAAHYMATSVTRARFNVPTINGIARMQFWPVTRSATVPSVPLINDYRLYPWPMPTNEEIAVEGSNNLGAATEESTAFIWVAAGGWNLNLPRGERRLIVRATGAIAGVAASWSGGGAITFAENLKGGYYTIVGMQVFDAGTLAVRLIFPNGNSVGGRKMRPGVLCTEAIGNVPWDMQFGGMGVFGTFHTFEPPQAEIWANATAASTQEFRLDMIYHGTTNPGIGA